MRPEEGVASLCISVAYFNILEGGSVPTLGDVVRTARELAITENYGGFIDEATVLDAIQKMGSPVRCYGALQGDAQSVMFDEMKGLGTSCNGLPLSISGGV